MRTTDLRCACGRVQLQVAGDTMVSVTCCCNSCRTAAERMSKRADAPDFTLPDGTTPYVFYRKDRIKFVSGVEHLKGFFLTDQQKTRRVIATCCNTPVFLEAKGGHWLSIYAVMWPPGTAPALELRTMSADLPAGVSFDDDVPTPKTHVPWFFWRIFKAWAQMGFRSPKLPVIGALND